MRTSGRFFFFFPQQAAELLFQAGQADAEGGGALIPGQAAQGLFGGL